MNTTEHMSTRNEGDTTMANATGILKGRWTLWVLALFFSLVAGLGALTILGSAADRVPYYVVNQSIAAGVEITPDVILEIQAPADSVPPYAMTLEDIQGSQWFSRIALAGGTVLQKSVVMNDTSALTATLPDGFVLASILVAPEDAAGGRITRGNYVDIAALSGTDPESATAKIVMHRVYVYDVTVSPTSIAQAANSASIEDPNGESKTASPSALYSGTPSLYTLAVSPADFAKLALIRKASIYLALSAAKGPQGLDVSESAASLFAPGEVLQSTPTNGGNSGSTTGVTATTKAQVETFYTTYATKTGYALNVVDGTLTATDGTGVLVDTISLEGGSIDLATGVWTASR
jgi:Flp pilus assembly protein CpaB